MEGGGGLQSIYNPITRLIRPVLYRNRVKRANTNQRNVNKNIAIFVSNVELSIIVAIFPIVVFRSSKFIFLAKGLDQIGGMQIYFQINESRSNDEFRLIF